ncbi:MAG TPA: hypothetical protein IAA78_08570 [Candidatus Avamphibacillus intestinigallinarum]|nr:hypothetical protein [Candidatus Avamphibacillus intestinigallinarum]
MVGPALRKQHSHKSIHDGAHAEASELTEIVERLFEEQRAEECLKAGEMLIEFWQTRVIAHADSEEEEGGLYHEMKEKEPALRDDIIQLTRDHDILRKLVSELEKDVPEKKAIEQEHLHKFRALLIVNEIHSRSEEAILPEH